jgi:hypothetical protein
MLNIIRMETKGKPKGTCPHQAIIEEWLEADEAAIKPLDPSQPPSTNPF